MSLLDTALNAHAAGLCVLPPKQDGSKRPLVPWEKYQRTGSTNDEIRLWYTPNGARTGIGVVLGPSSGNLEMLEFDDALAYSEFKALAHDAGLGEMVERIEKGYLEESPNGIHWFYRCDEIGGNTKLARRPKTPEEMQHPNDNVKVLIETRGDGGFAIIAPSHGTVHPSGRPYRILSGDYDTIATITAEERRALFELARTLDRMPRREQKPTAAVERAPDGEERPGDWFNRTTTWAEVLEPHGWTWLFEHKGEEHWCRPGKRGGTSATTNYAGSDCLKVFSSSTIFDTETSYSRFAAYAVLNHGGDFTAAARALAGDMPQQEQRRPEVVEEPRWLHAVSDEEYTDWEPPGDEVELFGEPAPVVQIRERPAEASDEQPKQKPDRDIDTFLASPDPEYDWLIPGLIERGDRTIITAGEGDGKSTLMRQMAVQAAAGIHPFTLADVEPVTVMYLDVENSEKQFRRKIRPVRLAAGDFDPERLRIRVRSQGINLGSLIDQEWLEGRLEANRPDLLMIGPLYKLADGDPTEEKVAKPVAVFLDRMRAAYGFALVVEAHTPHASGNSSRRPERPYGASLWMRWPEFGIHLGKTGAVTHWRGARDEREWPTLLKRGGEWPWTVEADQRAITWARICEEVRSAGEKLSVRELAERMGGAQYRNQIQRAKDNNKAEWEALLDEV